MVFAPIGSYHKVKCMRISNDAGPSRGTAYVFSLEGSSWNGV